MKFRQPFQLFGGLLMVVVGVVVSVIPELVVYPRTLGLLLTVAGVGYVALFIEYAKQNGGQHGQ